MLPSYLYKEYTVEKESLHNQIINQQAAVQS